MSVEFFLADDGEHGRELWITNGTTVGTFMVRDFYPGINAATYANFVQSNGIMYFTATDNLGTHLWRSDGTSIGTYALTTAANGDGASNLVNVHGTLFFLANDSVHGPGLYKTDGTTGGTSFVATVNSASAFTVVGSSLFFQASDGTHGAELWVSDGTSAGTHLVKDINPGTATSGISNLTASGGKLYFVANDGVDGRELWVSDGTSAGTHLVKDTANGTTDGSVSNLISAGSGRLFYYADQGGGSGRQLWSTDGDTAALLTSGTFGGSITNETVFNNTLYFVGNDTPSGKAIFTSDGLSLSAPIAHMDTFTGPFYNLGDKLLFRGTNSSGTGLFSLDGSGVSYVGTFPSSISQAVVANGQLFFVHNDGTHGNELWVTNGEPGGTHLTADLNPGVYDSGISNIHPAGAGVVFTATIPGYGNELFYSDGTTTGLLRDINPNADHSPSLSIGAMTGSGSQAFFVANDNVHGNELWTSNGQAGGTFMVKDANVGSNSSTISPWAVLGGKLIFRQNDGSGAGSQLWVSDGTAGNEIRLTTSGLGGSPNGDDWIVWNGAVYYMGLDTAAHGGAYALYRTDGSGAPVWIKHFNGYDTGETFQVLNGNLLVHGSDGTTSNGLFSFDGTSFTTLDTTSSYQSPIVASGRLYYVSTAGGHGSELWVTDGSVGGAHLAADANPGIYDSFPALLTPFATGLAFRAYEPGHGSELWFSDANGTRLVSDVNSTGDLSPSFSLNAPQAGTASLAFFVGNDAIHGYELWVSNGSSLAGTFMVKDANVGSNSSSISPWAVLGGKLIFRQDDGSGAGSQLWVSDGTPGNETRLTTSGLGGSPNGDDWIVWNGAVYYMGLDTAANGGAYALYRADGSGAPVRIKHFNGYDTGNTFEVLNGNLVIHGSDGTTSNGLFSSDGSVFTTLDATASYNNVTVASGRLYYVSTDGGHGSELWVTDGSVGGAHLAADANPGIYDSSPALLTPFATGLAFRAYDSGHGSELWFSDANGTQLVTDLNSTGDLTPSFSLSAPQAGNASLAFFVGNDAIHGYELWVSNGSSLAGTFMVKDANVGSNSSSLNPWAVIGGKLIFRQDDGSGTGSQLWVSDGTPGNETRLTTSGQGGTPNGDNWIEWNGAIYYMGLDTAANGGAYALYRTDGTGAPVHVQHFGSYDTGTPFAILNGKLILHAYDGTWRLFSYDGSAVTALDSVTGFSSPVEANGHLFFVSSDGGQGLELWATDGTPGNAQQLKDINPGGAWSSPSKLTAAGSLVYFTADDGVHGTEMWVSDGTPQNTRLLLDINEGAQTSNPDNLTAVGSLLFFTANDFSAGGGAHGVELWVTDGTSTRLLYDINPGVPASSPTNLTKVGGKLVFTAYDGVSWKLLATDGIQASPTVLTATGGEATTNPTSFMSDGNGGLYFRADGGVFHSDGTSAGTHFITAYNGFDSAGVVGGKLYWRMYDAVNNYELWVSDGTSATRVTNTLLPNGSNITEMAVAGGKLFYSANDGVHGQELFVYDGVTASLVKDLNPTGAGGINDSTPTHLTAVGSAIVFTAYDGAGWKLFVSGGDAASTQMLPSVGGEATTNPTDFMPDGNGGLFFRADGGVFHSDGTVAGTHFITTYNGFDSAGVVGGKLYWRMYDAVNNYELWVSDGTSATRVTNTQLPNSSNITEMAVAGGKLFFSADDGIHGQELFAYDGNGVSLVKDLNPTGAGGINASSPSHLTVLGNNIVFTAYDGTGWKLFVSGGDAATTQVLNSAGGQATTNPVDFMADGAGGLYFRADGGLFHSDGTSGGTHFITAINGFDSAAVVGGKLYWRMYDAVNSYELWVTDGSTATRVTDTATPFSSNPGTFAIVDNFPPTVDGAATAAIDDNVTVKPFAGVTIGDPDFPIQTLTVTITPDDTAKGAFTAASLTASGFVGGGVGGAYTFTGTAAQATAAIQALILQPTANRLAVGLSEALAFSLVVDDGAGGSITNNATVVTITSVNDAPTPSNDSAAVNEDATTIQPAASGLLFNDTDPDVNETAGLKVATVKAGLGAEVAVAGTGTTSIAGTYGTLHIAANGSYDYTPDNSAAQALSQGMPTTEIFTYKVKDEHGATSTATLTFNITGQEDAPQAVHDDVAATEDLAAHADTRAAGLLANDTDVDFLEQGVLRVTGAHAGTAADTAIASGGSASITGALGTLTLNSDGTYSYLADNAIAQALAIGQSATDTFSYTIVDPQNVSSSATVTFTVAGANDVPVGSNEGIGLDENDSRSALTRAAGLLANDTDPDGGETATLKIVSANLLNSATSVTIPNGGSGDIDGQYGTLHLNSDGTYSYAADSAAADALRAGTNGIDSFNYTISDTHGASVTALVSFTIAGQEDAPVAHPDAVAATEDVSAQTFARADGLLGNDSDLDEFEAGQLVVTGGHHGTDADTPVTVLDGATLTGALGTLTLNQDGTYSYLANNAAAQALGVGQTATDTFSYTIKDNQNVTSTSTVTFTVTGANDDPVAVGEGPVAVFEDATARAATRSGGLLGNDSDIDSGDTALLKATAAHSGANGDTPVAADGSAATIAGTYGDLVLRADGTYEYTPDKAPAQALAAGAHASEAFTYTVSDGHGGNASATVTFDITGTNDAAGFSYQSSSIAFVEGGSRVAILAGGVTVADDNGSFAGATLTIAITDARPGDLLVPTPYGGYSLVLAAVGEVRDASNVTVATFTQTDASITFTLTAAATLTTVSNLTKMADFKNMSDDPGSDPRHISFTFVDGEGTANGGHDTEAFTTTLDVLPVNDPPAGADRSVATDEDIAYALKSSDFGFSDVDHNAFAGVVVTTVPSGGTLKIDGNAVDPGDFVAAADIAAGKLVFTPAQDVNGAGAYSFTFQVRDDGGTANGGADTDPSANTLTFDINPVNDAPVAAADANSVDEDLSVTATTRAQGVLGNDSDVDTGDAAILVVTGAHSGSGAAADSAAGIEIAGSYGRLTLQSDGRYSYTADGSAAQALAQGVHATDTFTYTVSDTHGGTATATLSFGVTGVDDAPVSAGDSYATDEDRPLTVSAAAGLLANDGDVDTARASLSAVLVAGPSHGSLSVQPDGSFTYTPSADYSGSDSFTYKASDGTVDGNTVTVSLSVAAVNDAPTVSIPATLAAAEQVPLNLKGSIAIGDVDAGGAILDVTIGVQEGYGSLHFEAGGSGVVIRDNDTRLVSLSGTLAQLNALFGSDATSVATYTAPGDAPPPTAALSLFVSDNGATGGGTQYGLGLTEITITPVNDAPTAAADAYSIDEDATLSVNAASGVLVNDSDPDLDNPTLTATLVTGPAHGTLTLNPDGSFAYTPSADYNGSDGFTYRANDGALNGNTATVSLTVNAVNDAPSVSFAPGLTALEQVAFDLKGRVTLADPDAGSATLTATLSIDHGLLHLATGTSGATIVSGNDSGSVVVSGSLAQLNALLGSDANSLVSFTATGDQPPATTGFHVSLDDNGATGGPAQTGSATATITIRPVNDAPSGTDGSATLVEATSYTFSAASFGFVDVDGNLFGGVQIDTLPAPAEGVLMADGHAVTAGDFVDAATIAAGKLVYEAAAHYAGVHDVAITFQVLDDGDASNGGSNVDPTPNSFTFHARPADFPPVSGDDSYAATEDNALTVAAAQGLLANDSDPDTASFHAVLVSGPSHSAAFTLNPDGSFSYTPAADFNGSDSFTYKANDGTLDGNVATVTISVGAVNDAPVNHFPGGPVSGSEDGSIAFTGGYAISIGDVDAGTGAIDVILTATHGTLAAIAGGAAGVTGGGSATLHVSGALAEVNATLASLAFTPDGDFNGNATLAISTSDNGNSGSGGPLGDSDTIAIHVDAVNDAPVVVGDPAIVLAAIDEDMPSVTGQKVTDLVSSHYSDAKDQQSAFGGSSPGSFTGIAVTANGSGAAGSWQFFDGSIWVDIGAVDDAHAKLISSQSFIRFNPAADYNGPAPALIAHLIDNSLDFGFTSGQVADASVTGGATAYSSATISFGETVNAVNDAPVVDLNGAAGGSSVSIAFTENDPATILAAAAKVTDMDSTDFAGGQLMASFAAGGTADDRLAILAGGDITTGAGSVSYQGQVIGSVSGGTDGATALTISLNASASPAAVEALLRAVAFANASESPVGGDRTISFTLSDGDGGTSAAATATVSVSPVEDPSVARADHVSTGEDVVVSGDLFADNGSGADFDLDGPAFQVIAVNGQAAAVGSTIDLASGARLRVNGDGKFTYDPNHHFDGLAAAVQTDDSFSYTISGGSTALVTVTLNGANDTPTVTSAILTAGLSEPGLPTGTVTGSGTIAFSDPDLGDVHSVSRVAIGNPLGTLGVALDAETSGGTGGQVSWSYSVAAGLVDYLSAGETRVESFTITLSDGKGGSVSRQVDVTITGTNDAPVAGADTAETDRYDPITLDLLANDSDVDHLDTLTITGASLSSGLGTVSVTPDGRHVSYFANHQYDSLVSGQSVPVTISYTISDSHGGTATGTATVTVLASNVPPVILGTSDLRAAATEIGDHASGENSASDIAAGAILFADGDASNTHSASFVAQGAAYLGTFTLAPVDQVNHRVGWSFSVSDSLLNSLAQGETIRQFYIVTVDDGRGGTASEVVEIDLVGSNDAAHLSSASLIVEQGVVPVTAGGQLTISDEDGPASFIVQASAAGAYGHFSVDAAGLWSYAADQLVSVAAGQFLTDSFTVLAADGTPTTVAVTITGADQPAIARTDLFITDEATPIGPGLSLFADNGGGADSDPDGPLAISAVNGVAGAVGRVVVLASGALVTVNADGTFRYDPNHAFDGLSQAPGASNQFAYDSFTYTLQGGSTATVFIDVTGLSSSGDRLSGDSGDNQVDGSAAPDSFLLQQGGDDSASGQGGNDGFYFGAAFTGGDSVDGGDGTDTIALQGNTSTRLGDVTNVEVLLALSGSDTRFGDNADNRYDYDLTTNDGNVGAGQTLTVQATGLLPGEDMHFDGSAETDGNFRIFAGQGVDDLRGGAGSDGFFFGADGNLTGADHVEGGAGIDSLALRGNYVGANAVVFQDGSFSGIEVIALLSSHTNEFSGVIVPTGYDYDLTMADGNVAAGQMLDVNAARLGADESVRFDGHLETDGAFRILSGAGDDSLIGGAGNDTLYGGLGKDRLEGGSGADAYVYRSAAESTSTGYDVITGFDWHVDRIDAPGGTRTLSHAGSGALSTASFDADLAAGLNGVLGVGQAALFTATSGTLSGHVFAVIDANGVAGYQAGEDLVIELANAVLPIDPASGVIL